MMNREPTWNIHPGEILREEFLNPLGITAYRLAKELKVPAPRINDIILERRGISVDTALRLAKYFNMTPQFWMNLQTSYEMRDVQAKLGPEIKAIHPLNNHSTH
jgi:addiction module HigA family antidote